MAPAYTVVVVTDTHVAELHLAVVVQSLREALPRSRVLSRAIEAGEQSKTRERWADLTDWMLGERCGRDTTVVALGGGVVGDLAGFVAATFMRGVPFVQVPTSLLAMVDASVGGKVGVDTPSGKNLVGAFFQPRGVVVDPSALRTLPQPHRRAGMAEVIKHGIIADAGYLERALTVGPALVGGEHLDWQGSAVTALVARSIEIKADVVRADEREAGIRQILNFGHTIGHAIEAASDYALLHGEAIAIGMVLESRLAERIGVAASGTADTVRSALQRVALPVERPATLAPTRLLDLMRTDKKSRAGELIFSLPEAVGRMSGSASRFGIAVDERDVLSVLE